MTQPELRRATTADLAAVTALVHASFAGYVERIGKPPAPMLADYAAVLRDGRIWVLDGPDGLVGMLATLPRADHLLLDVVAVAPGAQGAGHGARLLARAERDAAERGLAEIRLVTNEAMTENIVYYPRRGYTETGRGVEDGYRRVFFRKRLLQSPPAGGLLPGTARTAAQHRILDAAMDLVGEHGVGGTSLQMIADAVGVTKAAVYHQFNTKNEIVIAMTERELASLVEPLADAEAEPDRTRARTVLLLRVIDVAVARRRWIGTLTNDPVVVRLLSEHPPFTAFVGRLYGVLLGEREDNGAHETGADDTEDRVAAAVVSAAIAGSVVNPVVSDVDDDTLRTVLGRIIRRVLDLPG